MSFLEPHHQNNRFRTIGPSGWSKRFTGFDRPGDLPAWRGDWRWNYAQYLACCASIDANLGRLVDHLNRTNRLDDTLIVFTSDPIATITGCSGCGTRAWSKGRRRVALVDLLAFG